MILRQQRNVGTEKRQSNNSAVIKQSPISSSREIQSNISLSSAETKAPPPEEDRKMTLTFSDLSQLKLGF